MALHLVGTLNVSNSVKAHCHRARGRNEQRKTVDIELTFEVAAEQVQPLFLRFVCEFFSLRGAFVFRPGFVLKMMDHLMYENR